MDNMFAEFFPQTCEKKADIRTQQIMVGQHQDQHSLETMRLQVVPLSPTAIYKHQCPPQPGTIVGLWPPNALLSPFIITWFFLLLSCQTAMLGTASGICNPSTAAAYLEGASKQLQFLAATGNCSSRQAEWPLQVLKIMHFHWRNMHLKEHMTSAKEFCSMLPLEKIGIV